MWQIEQFKKLSSEYPEMIVEVIEKLWAMEPKLKRMMVISAYLDGHINLGKAAELLDVHRLELQDEFKQKGIPLRIGPSNREEVSMRFYAKGA